MANLEKNNKEMDDVQTKENICKIKEKKDGEEKHEPDLLQKQGDADLKARLQLSDRKWVWHKREHDVGVLYKLIALAQWTKKEISAWGESIGDDDLPDEFYTDATDADEPPNPIDNLYDDRNPWYPPDYIPYVPRLLD